MVDASSPFLYDYAASSPAAKTPRAARGSRGEGIGLVEYSDRFTPSRSKTNMQSGYRLLKENHPVDSKEDNHVYTNLLRSELLGLSSPSMNERNETERALRTPENRNLFKFKNTPSKAENTAFHLSPMRMSNSIALNTPRKIPRKIPKVPFKVLDAPQLQDDFYLNLVDWSSANVLSVGLNNCVYLWSACTSRVTKLCDLGQDDTVTSVSWTQRGTHLAVGTNKGEVQIWDASQCRKVRTMTGHRQRVGSMAWNGYILSTGSRDHHILHRDVRQSEHYMMRCQGHRQEVCGLKWSFDEQQLASGGNDNKLYVWNMHSTSPVLKFTDHQAAVKAIAWSPHQHGLLASGGGTADRCIRFWNTVNNTAVSCVDTGSQVCNLVWSKNVNEIVSTHGYSLNQIIVWKYPGMSKVATLTGHTYRVLYLSMSPDGQTICTGAGDETLRFWNVFPSPKNRAGSGIATNVPLTRTIR